MSRVKNTTDAYDAQVGYESERNPVSQGMEQTVGRDLEDYVMEDRVPQMEVNGKQTSDMEAYGYDENPETMVMRKSDGWGTMAGSIGDHVPSENSIEKSKEVSKKTMDGNHKYIEVVEGNYAEDITTTEGKNMDEEDTDRNESHVSSHNTTTYIIIIAFLAIWAFLASGWAIQNFVEINKLNNLIFDLNNLFKPKENDELIIIISFIGYTKEAKLKQFNFNVGDLVTVKVVSEEGMSVEHNGKAYAIMKKDFHKLKLDHQIIEQLNNKIFDLIKQNFDLTNGINDLQKIMLNQAKEKKEFMNE